MMHAPELLIYLVLAVVFFGALLLLRIKDNA